MQSSQAAPHSIARPFAAWYYDECIARRAIDRFWSRQIPRQHEGRIHTVVARDAYRHNAGIRAFLDNAFKDYCTKDLPAPLLVQLETQIAADDAQAAAAAFFADLDSQAAGDATETSQTLPLPSNTPSIAGNIAPSTLAAASLLPAQTTAPPPVTPQNRPFGGYAIKKQAAPATAAPNKSHHIKCDSCPRMFPPNANNNGIHCTRCCNLMKGNDSSLDLAKVAQEAIQRRAMRKGGKRLPPASYERALQTEAHRPAPVRPQDQMSTSSSTGAHSVASLIGDGESAKRKRNIPGDDEQIPTPKRTGTIQRAVSQRRERSRYVGDDVLRALLLAEIARLDAALRPAKRNEPELYAPSGYKAVMVGGIGAET